MRDGLSGNVISRDDLEEILTEYLKKRDVDRARPVARVMIEQLRERNFILCYLGADNYAFVHRTFLEYFCASEFVHQFEKKQNISFSVLKDLYGERFQDEDWREVLRLISGMIDPCFTEKIIKHLLDQSVDSTKHVSMDEDEGLTYLEREGLSNVLLAAECLYEVSDSSNILETSEHLLGRLKQELLQNSLNADRLDRAAAQELTDTIAVVWREHPSTLSFLKDNLSYSADSNLLVPSLYSIVNCWSDEPETFDWLVEITQGKGEPEVYYAAMNALAYGWMDKAESLSLLKQAVEKNDLLIGGTAIDAIVDNGKGSISILNWLKGIAESERSRVNQKATDAIAKTWKTHPEILSWLKELAEKDTFFEWLNDTELGVKADWSEESSAIYWTCESIKYHALLNVKCKAIEVLSRYWCSQDVFDVLIKVAEQKHYDSIRTNATTKRARNSLDSSSSPSWRNFTFQDPFKKEYDYHDNPCQIALQVLVQQYPNHPETIDLLLDRSKNDTSEELRTWAIEQLNYLEPTPN